VLSLSALMQRGWTRRPTASVPPGRRCSLYMRMMKLQASASPWARPTAWTEPAHSAAARSAGGQPPGPRRGRQRTSRGWRLMNRPLHGALHPDDASSRCRPASFIPMPTHELGPPPGRVSAAGKGRIQWIAAGRAAVPQATWPTPACWPAPCRRRCRRSTPQLRFFVHVRASSQKFVKILSQ
jgi:hypothetical protein